jgi:hypothetical protein
MENIGGPWKLPGMIPGTRVKRPQKMIRVIIKRRNLAYYDYVVGMTILNSYGYGVQIQYYEHPRRWQYFRKVSKHT